MSHYYPISLDACIQRSPRGNRPTKTKLSWLEELISWIKCINHEIWQVQESKQKISKNCKLGSKLKLNNLNKLEGVWVALHCRAMAPKGPWSKALYWPSKHISNVISTHPDCQIMFQTIKIALQASQKPTIKSQQLAGKISTQNSWKQAQSITVSKLRSKLGTPTSVNWPCLKAQTR